MTRCSKHVFSPWASARNSMPKARERTSTCLSHAGTAKCAVWGKFTRWAVVQFLITSSVRFVLALFQFVEYDEGAASRFCDKK
jgi:hypothetical protein